MADLSVGGESEPGKQVGDLRGQFMIWAVDDAKVVVQRLQLVHVLGGLVFGDQQYADVAAQVESRGGDVAGGGAYVRQYLPELARETTRSCRLPCTRQCAGPRCFARRSNG